MARQNEQTDRRSGRWPFRNGSIRTSFGTGSSFGSSGSSSFVGKEDHEARSQEVAQEGSCCSSRFGSFGVSLS
jgi:hypothetical protein